MSDRILLDVIPFVVAGLAFGGAVAFKVVLNRSRPTEDDVRRIVREETRTNHLASIRSFTHMLERDGRADSPHGDESHPVNARPKLARAFSRVLSSKPEVLRERTVVRIGYGSEGLSVEVDLPGHDASSQVGVSAVASAGGVEPTVEDAADAGCPLPGVGSTPPTPTPDGEVAS